jgi:hypothetical protein
VKSCQLVVRFDLPTTAQARWAEGMCCSQVNVGSACWWARLKLPSRPVCISPQSYIQSRGRARMHNSELLMMVQEGVEEERQVGPQRGLVGVHVCVMSGAVGEPRVPRRGGACSSPRLHHAWPPGQAASL